MNSELSISCCLSDNFAQHFAVLAASALTNTPNASFRFHVLHSNLTDEHLARIRNMEELYPGRCRIVFHHVPEGSFKDAPRSSAHITHECYFRLLLPGLLVHESRTLYLDIDILVKGDIRPLFGIDIDGYACAAVNENSYPDGSLLSKTLLPEERTGDYFNSGVMLMDLGYIRAHGLEAVCRRILAEYGKHIGYADQDVLNYAFRNRVKWISPCWNFLGKWPKGWTGKREKPVIRHYTSFSQKPWNCKATRFTWIPYARYLLKSSFRAQVPAFILRHLRAFLWWRYHKNCVQCLDILGVRVWQER